MLFSSSAQRWEILKKHVELSIKSQSDTRWESRIKCIKPLRYNLKEVLLALKDFEAISIERKDGRAASETKSLIAHLSKWSFLLSVFIWYDILFQVNKAVKDSPLEGDESSIIVVTGGRPGPSSHCSLSKHQFKIK